MFFKTGVCWFCSIPNDITAQCTLKFNIFIKIHNEVILPNVQTTVTQMLSYLNPKVEKRCHAVRWNELMAVIKLKHLAKYVMHAFRKKKKSRYKKYIYYWAVSTLICSIKQTYILLLMHAVIFFIHASEKLEYVLM